MNEREMKLELKAWAYAMGYAVLGEGAGGIITTLLQRKGLMGTRKDLSAAAKAADPKAFIGGVLRKAGEKLNDDTPEGTRLGMYERRGGKWVQWIEKYEYDKMKAAST